MTAFNLPDDFRWGDFERYYGDDQPEQFYCPEHGMMEGDGCFKCEQGDTDE